MSAPANPFVTVRTEGALLPPDLLARILAADLDLGGLEPADYALTGGDRLREAASRAWSRAKSYWQSFATMRDVLGPDETGVTETREQWIFPLLRELGFGRPEFRAAAEELGGRRYPIQHRSGPVPLHVVSFRQEDLERAVAAGAGQPRVSPHALVQEYLNRSHTALYGIVTNGLHMRLLRDNQSLTRLAYVDFDLLAMFEGGEYADFMLLFLTLHRTRLPRAGEEASRCWLEVWRDKAETQGTRALGALRVGVEKAIEALGNGLLTHPENDALRASLRSGELTTLAWYAELLRVIYRLIFLFVAEERDLLFPDGARPELKALYRDNYSAGRLREVARRHRSDSRHDDLWRSLRVTFDLLAGRRRGLNLVPLEGLFAADACRHLDAAQLANSALAEAVLQLGNVRVAKRVRRVNYRDMGAEELGGVYEGLLDRQPRVAVDAPPGAQFTLVGSGERKSSGSFYTPSSLVQELVRSALEPVVADRLAQAGKSRTDQERALLSISVCDTACGSGHFLLAAARRLGAELARIRADDREPGPKELRAAQRDVVRHCIHGVDLSPLSVDLCRLSLWLESYDTGRPLSFLDHHVKVGNSLIGANPELVEGGLPDSAFDPIGDDDKELARRLRKRNREERPRKSGWRGVRESQAAYLTGTGGLLVDWSELAEGLADESRTIAELPDATAEEVHATRERYERYVVDQVDPLRERLDAWTAVFFWRLVPGGLPPPTTSDLRVDAQGRAVGLSDGQHAEALALRDHHKFFHWPLEFPQVFERGGFDCVLGNAPWERIKLQEQEFFAERDPDIANALNKAARQRLIDTLQVRDPALSAAFVEAKREAEGQSKFVRGSGRFPLTAVGDVNLYALFAEHKRAVLNDHGRAGVIVPTGIATDDSTKAFFQDVVERRSLVSYFGFKNEQFLFARPVEHTVTFGLLTMLGAAERAEKMKFTWFAYNTDHMNNPARRIVLTPEDLALLNPNTRTCPVFRTRADADLTRAIYRRVPVLVDERRGLNPWGVQFLAMFHMSNDSGLFRDAPGTGLVPLYEAKLFHQFNHRWATYDGSDARDATPQELSEPAWTIRPRYWVEQSEVNARLRDRWDRDWLVAYRRIARATDERTMLLTVLPRGATGDPAMVLFAGPKHGTKCVAAMVASFGSLILDYTVRQKLGGTDVRNHYLKQFPVLPPSVYTPADLDFISPRVLELTYTAWDLKPFAEDLDYNGPPFPWDDERRALLRAELDAYYAALYGLTRDELRYVLDPQDVYGPEFPGETFRVLKEREIRQYGEYRTRRLVLEAWDRLGLEPRNRDGRYDAEAPTLPSLPSSTPRDPVPPAPAEPARQPVPLLAQQTVHERSRTPARPLSLLPASEPLDRQAAPSRTPVAPNGSAQEGESPAEQPTLPGLSGGMVALRERVLKRSLEALRVSGPLTGREIAQRLVSLDKRIDRHLVNSVLTREGAAHVRHNPVSGRYRVQAR